MRAILGALLSIIYVFLVGLFTGGLKGIHSHAGSIDTVISRTFGIDVVLSGKPPPATGRTLVISNHPSFLDGFIISQWAARHGCLSRIRFITAEWVKQKLPLPFGLGAHHLISIKRSWEADKATLEAAVAALPADAILFFLPEGTTFCPESLEKSVDFARKNGYPVFRHLLCPRIRGLEFVLGLTKWNTIIDMTLDCPERAANPFAGSDFEYLLRGNYARTYNVTWKVVDQPSSANCSRWLMRLWQEKDSYLERRLLGDSS